MNIYIYIYNFLFFYFLDTYVNNNQIDIDKFKERNCPSNIYVGKKLKLLVNYENNVKNATSLKIQFENRY